MSASELIRDQLSGSGRAMSTGQLLRRIKRRCGVQLTPGVARQRLTDLYSMGLVKSWRIGNEAYYQWSVK